MAIIRNQEFLRSVSIWVFDFDVLKIMKMKNILILALIVSSMLGCGKKILDKNPQVSPSSPLFYKSSGDFMNAISGIYSVLQTSGIREIFQFGDIPSDDTFSDAAQAITGDVDYDNLAVTAGSGRSANNLRDRWNNSFIAISRANILLTRIEDVVFGTALKNQYIGEAKFLRAYFYFTLVQTFGAVPLVITEVTSQEETFTYPRVPAEQIYQQIQQDLVDAAVLLPKRYTNAADKGRVTSFAASGLLARVLLFQSKFAEAAPVLKAVIDDPLKPSLLSTYAPVFLYNNGNNAEILFAIQYSSTVNGQQDAATNLFTARNRPTTDLLNAFSPLDTRRDISLAMTVPLPTVRKFFDPTSGQLGGTDYPILRYADILLMYAECLNEAGDVNGAVSYVNLIRQRAFGNNIHNYQTVNPLADSTYISGQSSLRNKILLERRLEFCAEGHRFWDLVRTNQLLRVLNSYFIANNIRLNGVHLQIKEHQKLYPVPQSILDLSRGLYTQNPGYN